MANSWNAQHFQPNQQTNQIQFFNPTQFQAPVAPIANPTTLKHNQHQNAVADQSNSHAGNVAQASPPEQQQQPSPYQGNASWGGAGTPASNSSGGGGNLQDTQSSWMSWGSWDWNQDQQNTANDQQMQQQHQPYQQHQQQQHDQHYQQQQHDQHYQQQQQQHDQHYQQQQQFDQHYQHHQPLQSIQHPQALPSQPIQHSQPPTSQPVQQPHYHHQQQQPPVSDSGQQHQHYNASWDTSGQHAQPGHQNFNQPATENGPSQDIHYNQPNNASYFGGDSDAFAGQNQFYGVGNGLDQQQHSPGGSGVVASQVEEVPGDQPQGELNSSMGLDQGQSSQVLYDQPSSLTHNPMASFSDNVPWLDNSQEHPHYPHPQQLDGNEVHLASGVNEGDNNVGKDNVSHHHHHSPQPAIVASNASPSLQLQHPSAGSSPSVPAISTSSPSHQYQPYAHPHHLQSPGAVASDASLHEYCDNDSDGGTVAGFFGRGDDDGDVSSDAQRSSNRSANVNSALNTSGGSADSTGGQPGMFLNVAAAGKQYARENSEISNASLSTFNMSVDDAGKEHLHELQALVTRMENVDIANRQAMEKSNLQEAPPPSGEFGQQHQGDFSGFGNESLSKTSHPPPQPPPSLNLDTNPVADRPSSPDGGIAASSESGGSGASGTSSGLTDWEIVPSQTQMTHSRNSSLDNNVAGFTDKPDGSSSQEPGRDGSSSRKDGGTTDSIPSLSSQAPQESFNPPTVANNPGGNVEDVASHLQSVPLSSGENLPVDNLNLSHSLHLPPVQAKLTAAFSPTVSTTMSSASQQQLPEGPLSFQPSKNPKMASTLSNNSGGSGSTQPPPPPMPATAATYFNPPLPVPNFPNPPTVSTEKSPNTQLPPSSDMFSSHPKPPPSMPQHVNTGSGPKLTSEDGARPSHGDRKSVPVPVPPTAASSSHPASDSEQKFRRPQDPESRRKGDNSGSSTSSQRRHQSAFHPIHRPRQTTVSPATTLWDTDSGSSSNILLAPAMPLIIPALNPYSSSAAATATTDVSAASTAATTANEAPKSSSVVSAKGKGSSKEPEQTPRSRYGDRDRGRDERERGRDERDRGRDERDRGRDERERGRDDQQRDREDTNRSFDSLDELDSGPDYRTPRDRPAKSERPDSRVDRRYDYDYPSGRGERPVSRAKGTSYRDDPQYGRQRGGYYGDSYYDEHYDRPRSRHEEAARNNSRPSSRSGGQEVDRPGSRAGEYDRDREYGYRDRNRGYNYNYDSYGRRDYYNPEDRDAYYRYYRDRDARYSRGYYEEYYGKNADYYLQQHQQERQARPGSRSQDNDGTGSRSHSRSQSQSHSRSNSQSRSQSRGYTPGPDHQQSDYYSRGSRPPSRQDYGRDYYRGYGGYDYAGYYDGYGYDPYAGYGYAGYADTASTQGYDQGRMTPPKYAYPHVRASFGSNGQLIKVLPNRPSDGQPAVVEVMEVQTVLEACQEAEDLKQFPGPLTREGTHKKDVLLLCQRKALECMEDVDMVDRESAQLVWKLLELLIKQNGSVVGTDLSDLLLDGHEPGVLQYSTAGGRAMSRQSNDGLEMMTEDSLEGDGSSRNSPALAMASGGVVRMDRTMITPGNQQREDCIARFRHLLLYGRKKDAIECAMKYNLWGHALFLASKMDTRTHASVMIRFANSAMRMNDPLQTLYQLMSGRQPASVTCVVDERWGDWRPHLAMILSNQTSRPDLDRKSITTLGDTLAAKGCLHASHFCYLMAQVPFGSYDKKTSKIVLVGASHYLPLKEFASMDAIQCTEVYEYSQTLSTNPAFCLPHFQLYKYLYACRLVDFGLVTEAFLYCEVMASAILHYPTYFQPSFVHLVFQLASQLKYSDPQRHNSHVDEHVEPAWIQQLQTLMDQYADGTIQPVSGTITPCDLRSNLDTSGGGDSKLLQPSYQQQAQQPQQQQQHSFHQPNASDTTAGDYSSQGGQVAGEVAAQASGSGGFEPQGAYQYSQQGGQADYGTGQYYQQDTTASIASTNDYQQQQQYPGYDTTDAATQQQQQQQYSYEDYNAATDATSYDHNQQQQQQEYNQWQQQQQQQPQYAGFDHTSYRADSQNHQLDHHHHHPYHHHYQQHTHAQMPPSSSSSSLLSSTVATPPNVEEYNHHHNHHHPHQHQQHLHSQQQPQNPVVEEDQGMDLTSSQASSGFSGPDGHMAMPPRASITTNETDEDDDDDDDDDDVDDGQQNGTVSGFDYFGNASQRVVVPPSRFRSPSESSASGSRRRRTISGSSTGSVKASPHKSKPPQTSSSSTNNGPGKSLSGAGGDLKDGSGGGWFGGLFSKFGRKGKNEMILPDDKDPAIVWDPSRNKWINADGTEEEVTVAAPPPKDTDLMAGGKTTSTSAPPPSSLPGSIPSGAPPSSMPPPSAPPSGANKFSLKAKGGRNQYVDVNNPKPITAPQGLFNVAPPMGNGAPGSTLPQVFLPGSTAATTTTTTNADSTTNTNNNSTNTNLLNVAAAASTNQDLSRSSSMSSVNQEVQRLTGQSERDTTTTQQPAPSNTAPPPSSMPMLFNPATLNTPGGHQVGPSPAGPGLKYGQRRAYPKK